MSDECERETDVRVILNDPLVDAKLVRRHIYEDRHRSANPQTHVLDPDKEETFSGTQWKKQVLLCEYAWRK